MQPREPAVRIIDYQAVSSRPVRAGPTASIILGISYAIIDIYLLGRTNAAIPLLLLVGMGIVLGISRGGLWFWVVGVCVFATHVLAIESGFRRPPYVEKDLVRASFSILSMIPVGFGAAVGVLSRTVLLKLRTVRNNRGQ